jgi:membrane-bound lytic murein transglycosylase D
MPTDRIHRVRRGDTLTSIAQRYGVAEAEIVAANRLSSRHVIGVGQRLRLPGAPETETETVTAAAEPLVVAAAAESAPAETPPLVAESPPIAPAPQEAPEEAPQPAPEASTSAPVVAPPQTPTNGSEPAPPSAPALSTPPPVVVALAPTETPLALSVPDPVAPAPPAPSEPASESAGPPSPDPSNYSVSKGDRVTIQADETLGHYAEWLEVRPSSLRRLNRMKPGAPVVIGRTAKLDFSHVTPEVFEQRRLQYHLALQEEFFEAYVVTGTETHVLKKGESLWYLAKEKFAVPLWLLRQYNPDLDFGALRAGTPMVVPVIEPREGQT